jgi:hypothetical protein
MVKMAQEVEAMCEVRALGAWNKDQNDIYLWPLAKHVTLLLDRILSYVHSTGKRWFKAAKISKSMIRGCWVRLTVRSFDRRHDSTGS